MAEFPNDFIAAYGVFALTFFRIIPIFCTLAILLAIEPNLPGLAPRVWQATRKFLFVALVLFLAVSLAYAIFGAGAAALYGEPRYWIATADNLLNLWVSIVLAAVGLVLRVWLRR